MLKRLMRRRNWLSKYLDRKCVSMHRNYENFNYNFDQNGEKLLIKRLSKLNFTCIFDVGAHIGEYSAMLRTYFPEAEIHTFEIIKDNISHIETRMKDYSHVHINNFGLSNEDGTVRVKKYGEGSELNSVFNYPHDGNSDWVDCLVEKGDSYINENQIEKVDFLKIDTEGSEHLILDGLLDTLKKGKIRVIQFEYGKISIITKFLMRDFYQLLNEYGYVVGKLYPKKVEFKDYELDDEDFLGPNFIAVKKNETEIIKLLSN
jgi:FkbM family methyltransferase